MKNILSKTVLALGITAMVMAGCTENGTSEKQYVYLSDAACTFQSAGNEPFTITVETSPAEWTVTPGASWVTAEKSGNDLVLTVADNADGMERTTTISVTAGQAEQTITVIQLSDDDLPMRFRKLADLHSSVISRTASGSAVTIRSVTNLPERSFISYSSTSKRTNVSNWAPIPNHSYS